MTSQAADAAANAGAPDALSGGCLCGDIRWHAGRGPRQVHHCHCGMCRRWTGAAFATLVWFDDAGRHQESLENDRPVDEAMFLQFHRTTTSLVRRLGGLNDMVRALRIVDVAIESQSSGQRMPCPLAES